MKHKQFWLSSLAVLGATLISCASESKGASGEYSSEEIYSLLSDLSSGYHVEGKLVQLNQYSGDYVLNTYTNTYTINRDYGTLLKGETSHDAIRIHSGDSTYTYYRGDTGRVTGDFYNYKNEVISENISLGLSSPYFDNKYLDPFDFITYKDFDSSLGIDAKKAALIVEEYFGVTVNVTEASFALEGTQITADFTISDKTCAFENDDDIEEYVIKSTLSLEFELSGVSFEELAPSTRENANLEAAFENNGDNYTLILQSASSSTDVAFCVTSSGILELQDYGSGSLTVGDYYYKKDGDSYVQYMYNPGKVVTFEKIGAVALSDVIPDFSSISPAIFDGVSSNTYALLSEAATYVPYYLTPGNYRLYEDSGESASITLDDDNKISSIDATFYYGGEYITYNQNIINRGSTSYPSFFDDTISDFI